MNTGFYIINNTEITRLGCGYRHVFALVGRKWAHVLDWANGDTAKVDVRELKSAVSAQPRKLVIRRCIARLADGRKHTRLERAAVAAAGRKGATL